MSMTASPVASIIDDQVRAISDYPLKPGQSIVDALGMERETPLSETPIAGYRIENGQRILEVKLCS